MSGLVIVRDLLNLYNVNEGTCLIVTYDLVCTTNQIQVRKDFEYCTLLPNQDYKGSGIIHY
jgi:hypothetical protein